MSEGVPETGVIGLLGARSLVGRELEHQLRDQSRLRVRRFTRDPDAIPGQGEWESIHAAPSPADTIATFVSLIPIWALADHAVWLEAFGCRRLVALSSTSRFTKRESRRPSDRELAARLADGEDAISTWAQEHGVVLTIVRPTMIYGTAADGNVSRMARILRRYRVFPVVGPARGLRQPVHVTDVAWAVARLAAARDASGLAHDYNISGAETLTYRELVRRVRATVPGPTAVVTVPGSAFRLAERVAPRSRTASLAAGMAERMATDMVFDHEAARRDFGYDPRCFEPPRL